MTRSFPTRGAAAAVLAAALGVTLASAGSAEAAPLANPAGCSSWATVAHTAVHVRECATLSKKTLTETIDIKNNSRSARTVSGEFAVSWGQAGTGFAFADIHVAGGTTRAMKHRFPGMAAHATFTITAGISVPGHVSPTVHTTITR